MEMGQRAAGRPRPRRGGWGRVAAALVAAAGLLAVARPAPANIMIKGPTTHTASVPITGLPAGLKATVTLNPDPVNYLAAAAAKGLLDTTFQADIKQYPGWTLNFAGVGLNGTLQINNYEATDSGTGRGGAYMNATYTPGKGDPGTLTFMQVFAYNAAANADKGRGTHIDPFPNDPGDKDPFYYTAKQQKDYGLTFSDSPSYPVTIAGTPAVTFDTYLVSFDSTKKTVTAYDGWEWGYQINAVKAAAGAPEPSTMTLLAVGAGCLAWARRRTGSRAEASRC